MAPELFNTLHVDWRACDMYSVGCVLLELLTSQIPFFDVDPEQLRQHVEFGARPHIPSVTEIPGATPALSPIVAQCLAITQSCLGPAELRPTAETFQKTLSALAKSALNL